MVKQDKTKILYIITKSAWAGAGKYVYDLATGLPKDQFESYVAAGGNDELAQKIKTAGVPYYNIKNFQRDINVFKDIIAFLEILKLLFKIKPNVIHVSSSKAAGLASVAINLRRCTEIVQRQRLHKAIFTVHGWGFHEKRPKWQISLIKLFSKITCFYYNKIICVSEYDRLSAIKNKIAPAKKLITIHNGIKPEEYEFLSREKARKQLGNLIPYLETKFPSEVWIGTIGENTKNKGHKYLKKAIKNSIIISDLPQGYNYLKAFDIFILPSIKEGLPYMLLEAGLARLPVVATNVGGIPEIIINPSEKPGVIPTGLLIEPKKTQEIKEAVEKLINDNELKNELAFNLWQKIYREFTFEKMLRATLAAYEKNSKAG